MKDKLAVLILVINVVFAVECPKDHGDWTELVLKHEDCGKFYKCTPNGPIVMSCPDGLYFNPKTYQCDWKENVVCSEENSSEGKEIETEEVYERESKEIDNSEMVDSEGEDSNESDMKFLENGCPVNSHIHWLLPDENDCSIFYYCVHGEKVKKSCPRNLHFNRNTQVCDWPDVAGCAISSEVDDSADNNTDENGSETNSSEDNPSEPDDNTEEDISEKDTSEEDLSEKETSEEDPSEKETSEEDTSDAVEEESKEVDTPEDDSQIESQLFKKIEAFVNVNLLHLAP